MQCIAISNHKGGVAKTATTHALGVVLANSRRVLLIDADPQSSLSAACGVEDTAGRSLAEVITGDLTMTAAIRNLGPNLSLVPGDIALASVEMALVNRLGRENAIRRPLATVSGFDVVLIDTPPSLALLTVCALVASDGVLIPVQAQAADLRGLRLFLDSVDQVREGLSRDLQIVGILPTFVDSRLVHHQAALQAMIGAGLPVLPVTIPRSVRVAEAMAGGGESVVTYDRRGTAAAAYTELGRIVEGWLDNHRT